MFGRAVIVGLVLLGGNSNGMRGHTIRAPLEVLQEAYIYVPVVPSL